MYQLIYLELYVSQHRVEIWVFKEDGLVLIEFNNLRAHLFNINFGLAG